MVMNVNIVQEMFVFLLTFYAIVWSSSAKAKQKFRILIKFKFKYLLGLMKDRSYILEYLFYDSNGFFCLKFKISIITGLFGFASLGKLRLGPLMVLGYFFFRFISLYGFKLFF